MGVLFIFILISVLVVSALLFFNKGEKAQEIKSILKDIFENFKELFSNLKKLFSILKELFKSKSDEEPTLIKDESTDSKPDVAPEPDVTPEIDLIPATDITPEPDIPPEPKVASELSLIHI